MSDSPHATPTQPAFTTALLSGAIAGLSVDITLFPLDTLKTRLQSSQGFIAAGGFSGVYKGLGAAAIGSAPGAALFFTVYESMKPAVLNFNSKYFSIDPTSSSGKSASHMGAACCGEIAACMVRVPTEVVKTRMQTSKASGNSVAKTVSAIVSDGGVFGLYRGFGITIMREIPFALIQFPIYEGLKHNWSVRQGRECRPYESALCGSMGGAISAAITTPLDFIKTRTMLQTRDVKFGVVETTKRIVREEGYGKLMSGVQPRVMWTAIGGGIFFYGYEKAKEVISGL